MSGLPDGSPLSEVTMPGTHDTMAHYGGPLVIWQSWSLEAQLRAGVRFLDIRVRHFNGGLPIHHGAFYQHANFGDVLQGVKDFLNNYPSETVLMRVREEYSETHDIYGAVVSYLHRYGCWDMLWNSRVMPTMGQARGKIIILQNFTGPALGMSYGSLDIANNWRVPTLLDVDFKWESVHNHLELAPVGNMARMFLTFTSGSGGGAYPNAVAGRINAKLYVYLTYKRGKKQRFGVIIMDYPAAPLIQMIIDSN